MLNLLSNENGDHNNLSSVKIFHHCIFLFISIFIISCGESGTAIIDKIQESKSTYFTPTLKTNTLASGGSTQLTIFSNAAVDGYEKLSIIYDDTLVSLSNDFCIIVETETHCDVVLTASNVIKTTSGTLSFSRSSSINSNFIPASVTYTIEPYTNTTLLTASFSDTLNSGQIADIIIEANQAAPSNITIIATDYNSDLYVQKLGYIYYTNGNSCTITTGKIECRIPIQASTVFEDTPWTLNLATFNPIANFEADSLDYTVYASDNSNVNVEAYLSPNPIASGETGRLLLQTTKSPAEDINISITSFDNTQLSIPSSSCTIIAATSACMIEVTALNITEAETGTISLESDDYTIADIDYDIDTQTFDGLVRGWPDYLAMGNITDASIYVGSDLSSTQVSLAQYPVNAIFKYAGTGQPYDQNDAITFPYSTYQTIAQSSFLTQDYASPNALPAGTSTTKPTMVVYTANSSYSWYPVVNDFTGGVMMNYFSKLILIAQLLEKKGMGSVILNPDLLGNFEKNYDTDYVDVNKQLSDNKDYTVQNSLDAAVSFSTRYQSFSNVNCEGLEELYVTPLELFNVLIETCNPNYLYAAYEDWNDIMTTSGPDISTTTGSENYSPPDLSSNNVIAWINATNWIMHTFAPNISYGWQENLWATGSSTWIYGATADTISSQATKINSYLEEWAVFNGQYQPDFIVFDRYEGDDFMPEVYEASYLYNASSWSNYLNFVGEMSNTLEKPAMIWQIPGAHIQTSDDIDNDPTRITDQHGGTAPNFFFSETQGGIAAVDYDNLMAYIDNITFTLSNGSFDIDVAMPDYLQMQPDGSTDDIYYWNEGHLDNTTNNNIFAILWGGGNQATGAIDIALNTELYDNGWLGTRISSYLNNPEYFPTQTELPFCVWLNPNTKGQASLDAIVEENISGTRCPFFDAHITLFCGSTDLPKQALINQFNTAFANENTTEASILGTQWGTDFFKRFYYQIKNNTQLENLYETASTLNNSSTYRFAPHISLFYGNESDIPEDKVLSAPHLENLNFNKISLMSDCSEETYACVSSWEEYASMSLNE
ncbi:hypothetical protein [Shewanella surugensis]|uniref:Glycoside hydrolase 123 C-terminal domain-containing protein n=1 Tax=Shewanella surugensis TaxID=212020 RepID=A0ABT0LEY8_9GAMM|nr:hypothetical protein [Shewanella surugensis]MCL1126263.1 hypothetical protein [Shewanella surugensis]